MRPLAQQSPLRTKKARGVFLLTLDRMLVYHRSLPRYLVGLPNNLPVPINFKLVGWRELGGTARDTCKCLAQEHNTMSPARVQTQTAHSRVRHTNYEATTHPTLGQNPT